MKRAHSVAGLFVATLLSLSFVSCAGTSQQSSGGGNPPPSRATSYYLDCSLQANGTGTQASPWNSLVSANAFTFQPGDRLLLKRGATCSGSLIPMGSGANGNPIVIDAYGNGARPILDGGMNTDTVELANKQYWEVNNLEIVGGDIWGIYVGTTQPNSVLNHVYLSNLDVHGAHHQVVDHGDSGEVHVDCPCNDILIDSVAAHNSTISDGIFVGGPVTPLSTNVIVQNSTVHDVGGIGILLMEVKNSTIQNSVAYNTGLCSGCNFSSDGIVIVTCQNCVMQNNESYANHTPITLYDGGGFDLEDSVNSVVQYNYGHDSDGYCLAHFTGPSVMPANNVFRYNLCSNNGQMSSLSYQGELVLNAGYGATSNAFDGVQIYNNTFYWNPAAAGPVVSMEYASYAGANPNFFKNNILYSTVPDMIHATSGLSVDDNIYWTTSGNAATWQIDGNTYVGFTVYQTGTGQDSHSLESDPLMLNPTYHSVGRPTTAFTLQPGSPAAGSGTDVCNGIPGCSVGTQDFWGNPLSNVNSYNVGAYQ